MPGCFIQIYNAERKGLPPVPLDFEELPRLPAHERIDGAVLKRIVVGSFKTNCRGYVKESYGATALEAADFILVAARPGRPSGIVLRSSPPVAVCGFALLKRQPGREMFLDVLCSCCHYGRRLLEVAESFSRSQGYDRMRLSALPHVINFYKERQYAETDNACSASTMSERDGDDIDGYRMTKCITQEAEASRRRRVAATRALELLTQPAAQKAAQQQEATGRKRRAER